MSEFEFIIGIFTIVLGLGTTHLLSTIADTIKYRASIKAYWIHTAWCVVMQFSLIGYWYGAWRGLHELSEFPYLFFVGGFLLNAVVPYLACRFLSVDIEANPKLDLESHYHTIRVPFFVCYAVPMLQGAFGDSPIGYVETATPILDALVSWEMFVVAIVGISFKSNRVQGGLVIFHFIFYLLTEIQQVQIGF